MTKKPFFSIIIPALNEEKYLPKLLDDLSKQTFRDFEVIVVDGKSEDKTIELAKTFIDKLPKLTLLTSDRRHVCTQRNLGAKHAIGEVLIFSDADNQIDSSFLLGLKYRWEISSADILSCWFRPDISSPQNDSIALALNIFMEIQNSVKPTYLIEGLVTINKSCFKKIGGFDESINFAEGKSLIKSINNLGYKYTIIKDPTYTLSFRRYRKFGILGLASRTAKLELSSLFNSKIDPKQLYPMTGGTIFKNKKTQSKFQKNIAKLLKKLQEI